MGVWDKLKGLFGAGGAKPPGGGDGDGGDGGNGDGSVKPPSRARRNSGRTWRLTKRGGTLALVAPHGTFPIKGVADEVVAAVAALAEGDEVVCEGDYVDGSTISELVVTKIVPSTSRPSTSPPVLRVVPAPVVTAGARTTGTTPTVSSTGVAATAASARAESDRYQANEILGLSMAEVRKRSLRINPYNTPWIGRVDTIPPQSDERTALIDRGLILRGLLSVEEIDEIHRVGDIWIRHHDAVTMVNTIAARASAAAVEQAKQAKAAKKAEKKQQAALRAAARAVEIRARREYDIVFAGRGVSARLHDRRTHVEELMRLGVPVLATPLDVAKALGLTVPQLRWLCFHAEAAEKTHYVYFEVPKRSGGTRLLASPHRKLRAAQQFVLDKILAKLDVTAHAHGFVAGRSTVTNARHHVGKAVVVNLDLKDFFPTITFPRVRGLFESIGYSPAAATLLALICTEAPRSPVVHDGRTYWVAAGDRALPQGACTSPMISNLVSRKLDRRLAGACAKLGFTYTRYADDLTFSGDATATTRLALLFARVRAIVRDEGFVVNENKGRVQRKARRQAVTGVVVNDKPGVPREEVRRLRAILHAAKKTGLAAQNRENHPDFDAYVRGKIAYVAMIAPERGAALRTAYDQLPR